jgi:hypothetical protein
MPKTASINLKVICAAFSTLLMAFNLAGCASFGSTSEADASATARYGPENAIHTPHANQVSSVDLADRFALMALFAKTTYRKDLLTNKAIDQNSCSYLNDAKHRDLYLAMPRNPDGSGWRRWGMSGSCVSERGLFFETYVHERVGGSIDEAVIAIRGTETGTLAEAIADFEASFSGVFSGMEGEYVLAEQAILPVIVSLKKVYGKDVKIYLVGHSLGGGIAQQIAYMTNEVVATFAFNTSPVTNWTRLVRERKVVNHDPVIHRITQHHEILAYLRKVTTPFNQPRMGRDDYEFDFVQQGTVGSHSMSHITCQLAARVPKSGGCHDYSYASATATLENPILCPNDVLDLVDKGLTRDRRRVADTGNAKYDDRQMCQEIFPGVR